MIAIWGPKWWKAKIKHNTLVVLPAPLAADSFDFSWNNLMASVQGLISPARTRSLQPTSVSDLFWLHKNNNSWFYAPSSSLSSTCTFFSISLRFVRFRTHLFNHSFSLQDLRVYLSVVQFVSALALTYTRYITTNPVSVIHLSFYVNDLLHCWIFFSCH